VRAAGSTTSLSLDDGSLRLADLLSDFATLVELTPTEVSRGQWLDAYLLAAGANQVIEDFLHPDPLASNRLAGRVEAHSVTGRAARQLLLGTGRALFRLGLREQRDWLNWQQAWAIQVITPLARAVAGPSVENPPLLEAATALAGKAHTAPARLRKAMLRLPSCFQSFDQQPADIRRLVARVAADWPDRERPLVVVGIRSSGSYLGPLCCAFLREAGYRNCVDMTLRPGRLLHANERAKLRRVSTQGGLALVLDDPPSSGRAFARAGALLEDAGFAPTSIVLLTPIFDSADGLPRTLARYRCVVLPWSEWAIHRQLAPVSVRAALVELLGGEAEVTTVERVPMPQQAWVRGHVRSRYAVRLRREGSATVEEVQVCVEGVGLGYFGTHALAVAERLEVFVPRVYGVRGGLLFRDWLPESASIGSHYPARTEDRQLAAEGIAAYCVTRQQALPLATDKSMDLAGRDPVWEMAGYIVEKSFGRLASRLMRPLVRAAVRSLLRPRRPTVVDGLTTLDRWFRADTPAGLRKVGFVERDFSNLDTFCCDPVYDLAGAVLMLGDHDFSSALRSAYEQRSGERVDPERWLLYRLVHAEATLRVHPDDFVGVQEEMARALRDYFDETILADCVAPDQGAVSAIDIDGVLETESLGFPGLTPAAALSVRALLRHGYRPVVATGRSLDEVRERCRAYGLAGGVAEYGAVIYDHRRQVVTDLLSPAATDDLARVRSVLDGVAGVCIESRFQRAVRAYRVDVGPIRRGLAPQFAAQALAEAGVEGRVRAIPGQAQTDFMVEGVDKGTGLRALLGQLEATEPNERARLAFAIGDSVSDLPMLALAERAFAPANADAAVRSAGIPLTGASFQLGFVEAVGALLGHPPGACSVCRAGRVSHRSALLLALLSAMDRPRWGKLRVAVGLARHLATQARRT
jgi:hydroxymethylpyrimidine pyrophosphatase-like HAD family hydrolase